MVQWRQESERWRKAHDKLQLEMRTNRDLIEHFRAFLRHKELHEQFVEFLLSACLGEEKATEIMKEIRDEKTQQGAVSSSSIREHGK